MVGLTSGRLAKMTSKSIVDLTISPLTAREAIVLSALHVGFFGVLFGLRFNVSSEVVGTTLIASTVLNAATLAASTYFTAGIGQS